MSMTPVSVVIPVGPKQHHRRWLTECLGSVFAQDVRPDEIVIVDDMAGLDLHEMGVYAEGRRLGIRVVQINPAWRLGVAHAFNFGVAEARSPLAFMLGADDILQPWCLRDCLARWDRNNDPLGYYYVDVEYMDTGEVQNLACNAAMVHKDLWRHTGGFPVESAVGAPDTMLLSILIKYHGEAGRMYHVESEKPPYLYRRHAETDTAARAGQFSQEIWTIRDKLTAGWTRPEWGRYL